MERCAEHCRALPSKIDVPSYSQVKKNCLYGEDGDPRDVFSIVYKSYKSLIKYPVQWWGKLMVYKLQRAIDGERC